jgi:uncharacterized cysteine cluster protein YcgN (CxxCxxCC family)
VTNNNDTTTAWPTVNPSEQPASSPDDPSSGGAFWQRKRLDQMSSTEWEALCDGCGRCCVHKLEDEDTGEYFQTQVACRLLDPGTCLCSDYTNRHAHVPDCITLTPERIASFQWLPVTCAYRRLAEGRGLAWWHPLVSGDPATVHQAGISVRHRTISEDRLTDPDELLDYVTDWDDDPGER